MAYAPLCAVSAALDFLPKLITDGADGADVWWASAPLGWDLFYLHSLGIVIPAILFVASFCGSKWAKEVL